MATTFADLGVPPTLVASLAARGIEQPFPIQTATLPDALEGRDLCGRAPTGSGKTIAFGIPMVLGIGKATARKPRGLVLVPTRELAGQVSRELQLLAKPKGPWVEAVYGGVGFDRQVNALRRGVDILVATPGRLADLIQQRWVDLSEVEIVVLDEADRMADMGFLPEVRRLLDQCPADRQTLLFSATLDGDVDVLIRNYQQDPARHEHTDPDEGGARAQHRFWAVERGSRVDVTASVIQRVGPTVVFTRTKHGADRLAKQLGTAGVSAVAIHGNRSQGQRERALQDFERGEVRALVATDVAARGIHVDGVACVLHFDPPADHKDYVHRSGRTARAGAKGQVVSLVPRELQGKVRTLQRELGYPQGFDKADVDALTAGEHRTPRPPRERSESKRTDGPRSDGPRREARPSRSSASTSGRPAGPRGTRTSGKPGSGSRSTTSRSTTSGKPGSAARSTTSRGTTSGKPGSGSRSTTSGGTTSGKPGSATRSTTSRSTDSRPPLPDGKRRPSGAARRKAKRQTAWSR